MEEIKREVNAAITAVTPTLVQQFSEHLTEAGLPPIMERLASLKIGQNRILEENKLLKLQMHRILEDEEIMGNKKNYSEVILYGLKEDPRTSDVNLAIQALEKVGVHNDAAIGEMILMTKRQHVRMPKVGEPRPLLITFGSDNWRDLAMKGGAKRLREMKKAKEPGMPLSGIGDNVTRTTRRKREVLYYIAGRLRGEATLPLSHQK